MKKISRILLLPLGLLKALMEMANQGARDLENRKRFKGAKIERQVSINKDSIIQKNVHILSSCIMNNTTIQSYSYIGRNSLIQNAEVGKFCSIANDVFIGLGSHPIEYFSTSPLFYKKENTLNIQLVEKDLQFEEYKKIIIGNDVWIGARAIILDGVKIGNGAIIASNSVVSKDVPSYAIVGGVPAKLLKYRFELEKRSMLEASQWWKWDIEEIKEKITELNRY